MPDIHIQREHGLGLAAARKLAFKWAAQVEDEFDMRCTYEEGRSRDQVCFSRSGISGTLKVSKDSFELEARLGFLLGAFKDRIEREIAKHLDAQLGNQPAAKKKKA